jgi:hypothetical protein
MKTPHEVIQDWLAAYNQRVAGAAAELYTRTRVSLSTLFTNSLRLQFRALLNEGGTRNVELS